MTTLRPHIIVTGANGMIGRHVVTALLDGGCFDVHVLGRTVDACAWPGPVIAHQVDLLRQDAITHLMQDIQASHLIHLAWVTEHGRFWQAPENLDWTAATLHLARAFIAAGGRRLVVAGSCAEYDWSASALPTGICHETETPTRPHTLYGVAKDACRRILASFCAGADVELAWGRIFLLFDANEDSRRLVAGIIDNLLAGRPALCSPGTQIRDFMAACDVGAAFAQLACSSVTGPVNIASGIGVSVADVAMTLGNLIQRPDLIRLGALPMRPDEPPCLVANVRILADIVGFRTNLALSDHLAVMLRQRRLK